MPRVIVYALLILLAGIISILVVDSEDRVDFVVLKLPNLVVVDENRLERATVMSRRGSTSLDRINPHIQGFELSDIGGRVTVAPNTDIARRGCAEVSIPNYELVQPEGFGVWRLIFSFDLVDEKIRTQLCGGNLTCMTESLFRSIRGPAALFCASFGVEGGFLCPTAGPYCGDQSSNPNQNPEHAGYGLPKRVARLIDRRLRGSSRAVLLLSILVYALGLIGLCWFGTTRWFDGRRGGLHLLGMAGLLSVLPAMIFILRSIR